MGIQTIFNEKSQSTQRIMAINLLVSILINKARNKVKPEKTVTKEWGSPYFSGEKPFFDLRKLSIMFWRKPGYALNEDRDNKRLGDVRRLIFKSNDKQVEER
ncbi:unnamed protein product, partial [Brassica rapa subsp. narinosa]